MARSRPRDLIYSRKSSGCVAGLGIGAGVDIEPVSSGKCGD